MAGAVGVSVGVSVVVVVVMGEAACTLSGHQRPHVRL